MELHAEKQLEAPTQDDGYSSHNCCCMHAKNVNARGNERRCKKNLVCHLLESNAIAQSKLWQKFEI
jgi:hypothetical protein